MIKIQLVGKYYLKINEYNRKLDILAYNNETNGYETPSLASSKKNWQFSGEVRITRSVQEISSHVI